MQLAMLLLETPGIGQQTVVSVLRRNAVQGVTPEQFLRLGARELRRDYGFRARQADALDVTARLRLSNVLESARRLQRSGVALLTPLEASYPQRLFERAAEPPGVLFAYGNMALLSGPLVSIANSNGACEESLAAGDRAAEAAHEAGWSLVTGHNRVAYQRAALAVRRRGGRICYVLDRGLLQGFGGDLTRDLFPAARIWGPAYDPASDLTLSPFALNAYGTAANNRRRDEVIFALADVVFAGYVRSGGQMERACRSALEGGRRVWLIRPGRESAADLQSAGAMPLDVGRADRLEAALSRT